MKVNRISYILFVLMLQLSDFAYSQSADRNYILSKKILDNGEITTVKYIDGLGRTVEVVGNGLGGNGKTVANYTKYDELDMPTENWNNFVCPGNSLDFIDESSAASLLENTYDGDKYGFTKTEYSIFGDLISMQGAGAAWHENGKKRTVGYFTNNDADKVKIYQAGDENASLIETGKYFPTGSLAKITETDEDGNITCTFKDKGGKIVLVRRGDSNDTYYVYNTVGQLCYVISPEYQNAKPKKQGEYDVYNGRYANLKAKYVYEYRYDERGRLVKKILPDCQYIQYWYDDADRLTYMQDGNLRSKKLYRFMFYDQLGRLALQGTCSACDRSKIGIPMAKLYTEYRGEANSMYAISGLDSDFKLKNIEIVNYYDNYDYLAAVIMKSNTLLHSKAENNSKVCAIGLQTGRIVRASNGEMLFNVMYYDAKGRIEKTLSTQLGGYLQETTMSYTFTDNPKRVTLTDYFSEDSIVVKANYDYEYNRFNDKLQCINLKVNNIIGTRIVDNTYDDLGRLLSARYSTIDDCDIVKYSYNSRNWLTSISSNHFSENIHYTDGIGTPCYNGNISSMQWQNGASSPKSGYKFAYDGLNRLTSAIYGEGDDMSQNIDRFSEKDIVYNENGSIYRMKRYGMLNDGSYGLVDDIKAKLAGNQLYHIDDFAAETNYKGAFDFNDADGIDKEYIYNNNGALVSDANKGIARIYYDDMNNPLRIVFTNGNTTEYVYSCTGTKLRTVHKTAIAGVSIGLNSGRILEASEVLSADSVDYHGNYIYENGSLDKILFEGGYARLREIGLPYKGEGGVRRIHYTKCCEYNYFIKDHLGNNRVVIRDIDAWSGAWSGGEFEVAQVTNYYPFGGVFSTNSYVKSSDAQPYKYNGKELDRTHGLDWYDYGARNYDAIVPMFTSIDPHCEKYYNKSPYVYGNNNPIRFVDPNGKDDWDKVVGFVYGIVTDVIPGTDGLRDSYTPSNYADYNTGLQNADKTSTVVGAALVVDGGKDVATGLSVASTSATVMVASGGTTAPVTGTTAVGGLTLAAKGGLEMGVGAVMLANTSKNSSKGYDRGKSKKMTRNEAQQEVLKGKAPKTIENVHPPHSGQKHAQPHVHLKKGRGAINQDGSGHDGPKPQLTAEEISFIRRIKGFINIF